MPALAHIQEKLRGMPPPERGHKRYVLVGKEAMRAICVDTNDHVQPDYINEAAVVITDNFPGWEVVDRPEISFSLAGKRR